MARLIDVLNFESLPSQITLQKGDVLSFKASGGHVNSGTEIVGLLGSFIPGILEDNGEILSPMGPPGIVMFFARQIGKARIDVVTGDPFFNPVTTQFEIVVS